MALSAESVRPVLPGAHVVELAVAGRDVCRAVHSIQGNPLLLINVVERKFVILGQIFWPQDMSFSPLRCWCSSPALPSSPPPTAGSGAVGPVRKPC